MTNEQIERAEKYIQEQLETQSCFLEDNLVQLWNEYLSYNGYGEEIHGMEMLDEVLENDTPTEVLQKAQQEDFRVNHDYFRIDDLENLQSCDYPSEEGWIDTETLSKFIVDRWEDFGNSDIGTALDELEEQFMEEDEDE